MSLLRSKLTQKEFAKRAEEILQALTLEVRPFKDEGEDTRRNRLERAREDPFFFFRTYLPHYFPISFAPFHYDLVTALENRPKDSVVIPVCVTAPREFAKTTITSFGYTLHQICFKKRHFIIIGSDTADLASDITAYIYLELLFNERIRTDFGVLTDNNLDSSDFVTNNDIRIMARGRGQRMRGVKHKQFRPDLVILDDMENDQSAASPKRSQELLNWIKGTVYPAIALNGALFIIGTLLSKKSALQQIMDSEEDSFIHWTKMQFRAINDDGDSLWPAKFPLEVLNRQKELMGTATFNREKLGLPDDSSAHFRPDWIETYDIIGKEGLVVMGFLDPALDADGANDYKALLTVGFLEKDLKYYVLDALIDRLPLNEVMNYAYQMHKKWHYAAFGIEDNLFQRLLVDEFNQKNKEMGVFLPVKGVHNHLSKFARIASMSSLFEHKKIILNRKQSNQERLYEQLIYFPDKNIHDDGPDALEGALRMYKLFGFRKNDYQTIEKRVFAFSGAY
jgi:predicted phage terminase large subunit-like protein